MKKQLRIAIVEFSPVHDLTFSTLATAADALGAQLDLYAPNLLLEQTAVLPGNVHRVRMGKGRGVGTVPAMVNRIARNHYDVIWVNTAHGPRARSLLLALKLLLPRHVIRLGVIHFTEKTIESWSTKIILDLLDGAVVFSKFLRQTMPQVLQHKTFAWYPMLPSKKPRLCLNDEKIRLIIPGALDPNRRDYAAIVKALNDPELDPRIQFILLGRCQPDQASTQDWLQQLPADAISSERVRLWNTYVSDDEFITELDKGHGVCLIMHPHCPQYRMFCAHQASGATYLAYCRGIPLLVESGMLPAVAEFGPHLLAYSVDEFTKACNQLAQNITENASENVRLKAPLPSSMTFQASRWIKMLRQLLTSGLSAEAANALPTNQHTK